MKKVLLVIFIYLATFFGCEVDPRIQLPECPTLEELLLYVYGEPDENSIGGGIEFIKPDSGATFVAYNPINENQIICYYSGYFTDYKSSLVTYDLYTGVFSSILVDPSLFSFPEISPNGWLLLTLSDSQIWKVKIDGDSITKLTAGGLNSNYTWSPDSESFIYSTTALSGISRVLLADKNGNTIYYFPEDFIIKKPTWSSDGKLIAYIKENNMDINIINTDTWEAENLIHVSGEYDINEAILDIQFYPDSKSILWSTQTALKRTNVSTGQTEIISSTCDSKGYSIFDISLDGNSIITKRVFYEVYDENNIILSSKFFICDTEGNIQNAVLF